MPWVRRSRHLLLRCDADGGLVALSLLTGRAEPLGDDELARVRGLPARAWVWRPAAEVDGLARRGLLVSDEPAEPFVSLRARDELLAAGGWEPHAAAFHLATRWSGVRGRYPPRDPRAVPAPPRPGRPLPAFHERPDAEAPVALPRPRAAGELQRVLRARRTARSFDPARPLAVDELASILRTVWGAHGRLPLAEGDEALRKTSPSGGGLHPVEVYPVLLRVEGLAPGHHHYRVRDHALERLGPVAPGEVERWLAGQDWFAAAPALFVMTARFGRSFWKYRSHAKAYRTVLLDAGHLSQTFYLVCTALGLGPFVTAAVNDVQLEERLGLDPAREGVLAVCGCGAPAAERSRIEPDFLSLDA
jgi:putative peptide maturation dehydrogenase